MFRKLTNDIYAAPQIGLPEIAEANALGVTLVINNRPEDESDDQTPGAEIEAAARVAGMDYVAIPVFSYWVPTNALTGRRPTSTSSPHLGPSRCRLSRGTSEVVQFKT